MGDYILHTENGVCKMERMEKIPCKDCGALILPVTAENTGGICMACKQGIRADIEKSRAYYASLREYDPVQELWKSLVKKSSNEPNLSTLTPEERVYFSVCLLEGEVYNGGFDQYFSNSSGRYYKDAIFGLSEIGAYNSLEIAQKASSVFFGKSLPPEDRTERWDIMKKARRWYFLPAKREALINELDKAFYEDPDNLLDLLTAYAEAHNLTRPFEK